MSVLNALSKVHSTGLSDWMVHERLQQKGDLHRIDFKKILFVKNIQTFNYIS